MGMRVMFFVIMFFLTTSLISAYYADVEVTIDDTGEVYVEGTTNHPSLQKGYHDEFISKDKGYWLIQFNTIDTLDDYIYHISLPPGAQINYIRSSGNPRIADEGDHISLIETGENKTIDLTVQYSVKKQKNSWFDIRTFFEVTILFLAVIGFVLYRRKKKKKSINFNDFPTRQAIILKELKKNKGEISQSSLEKKLKWPKSSLSRNIDSLVKKGAVQKIEKGKINLIKLL